MSYSLEDQQKILHDGYLEYLKFRKENPNRGFYYFLMNVWEGARKPIQNSRVVSILLIEDQESKAIMLEEVLHSILKSAHSYYTIEIARDGEQALELFKEKDFYLVLSDNRMPRKKGIEVFESLTHSLDFEKLKWFWTCADDYEVAQTLNQENVEYLGGEFNIASMQSKILAAIGLGQVLDDAVNS